MSLKVIFFIFVFISSCFSKDFQTIKEDGFLNIPYKANTLNKYDEKEKLNIDFSCVDCFIFIDYIEALKEADDLKEFKKNLIQVRYKDGKIAYKKRRHFFTNWLSNKNIKDITCEVGTCKKVEKYLNKKNEKDVYLKNIDIKKAIVSYVPIVKVNFSKLQTGDYIGIYTSKKGLDVTHVGMAVYKKGVWYFRHASSKVGKVIDSVLAEYIKNKKGILVFRSRR